LRFGTGIALPVDRQLFTGALSGPINPREELDMTITIGGVKYVPGMYKHMKLTGGQQAEAYIHDLDTKRVAEAKASSTPDFYPCICISRKIGVGALEIADAISEKIGLRVVDREILEYIAEEARLSQKTVEHFDECYPGKMDEFIQFLFGEKSFIKSDYSRRLFSAVLAIASAESTVFVGRGTHLILPRERVLAVRFICSDDYRAKRLARILKVSREEAEKSLEKIDREQQAFFKSVFNKKLASSYEFDLIVNCDYLPDVHLAADMVVDAYMKRFGSEIVRK